MGDPRRFDVFAAFIAEMWPDRSLAIGDIAGGKGGLCAALYHSDYRNVVTIDKRRNRANPERRHYRYGLLSVDEDEPFDLVVGMHPDEATDVIMAWAIRHGKPFAVVPCCARPTIWPYAGDGSDWIDHLESRAGDEVIRSRLNMSGANLVLFRA